MTTGLYTRVLGPKFDSTWGISFPLFERYLHFGRKGKASFPLPGEITEWACESQTIALIDINVTFRL